MEVLQDRFGTSDEAELLSDSICAGAAGASREAVAEGAGASDEDDEAAGLYEHFAITADKGQSLLRLDKFLTAHMMHCSRNRIQAAADSGNILVNGVPAKSSYKVKPFDRIQVVLPYPKTEYEIVPEDIPLTIPYEDDDIVLVDKPAGMVVHPGSAITVVRWSTPCRGICAHCRCSARVTRVRGWCTASTKIRRDCW